MPCRDGAELVPGCLRPRLFAALFQEREVSEEEKSRPALPAGVCARIKLAASPFPRAGMVESKALEVPQVRDALCFDPAGLLLSFLPGSVAVAARLASYLRWLVPVGCSNQGWA